MRPQVLSPGRRRFAASCRPSRPRHARPSHRAPTSRSPSRGSSSCCWSPPCRRWCWPPAGSRAAGCSLATLVGGSLAAGSANTINCYVDRDIDQVMHRTRKRPLVLHEVAPRSALIFGLVLGVLATSWLGFTTNWLSACSPTARSRSTSSSTRSGSSAVPRRTSSSAVRPAASRCSSAGRPSPAPSAGPPCCCSPIVFLWTPPHFWALAMRFRDDYAAAGVPMLPVVATPGRRRARGSWPTRG